MNVLEKILEEMNKIKDGNRKEKLYAKYPAKNKRQEILNIYSQGYEDGTDDFYNAIVPLVRAGIPLICSRMSDNDELIDRKALKEEIESLTMTITGMRSGKTMTILALEEYKKSILRIIDEQPTVYVNDGWIPVEERLPEDGQEVLVWYEYFRYGEYNRMFKTYGIGWQFDGHWSGDVSGTKARCIAWQPLPEQYKPEQPKPEKNTQQEIEDFWIDK